MNIDILLDRSQNAYYYLQKNWQEFLPTKNGILTNGTFNCHNYDSEFM